MAISKSKYRVYGVPKGEDKDNWWRDWLWIKDGRDLVLRAPSFFKAREYARDQGGVVVRELRKGE